MEGGIKPWVVYARRLFGGPKHVIEYLGRYTHKVAVNNHRITAVEAEQVSFRYKDYRDGGSTKTMTLCNEDFTKRFVQHIYRNALCACGITAYSAAVGSGESYKPYKKRCMYKNLQHQ